MDKSFKLGSFGGTTGSNFVNNSQMKTTFQTANTAKRTDANQMLLQRKMLEKNFTRQAHISNFIQGINELPTIMQGRPHVKGVKKR